jgi:hypothetical protein
MNLPNSSAAYLEAVTLAHRHAQEAEGVLRLPTNAREPRIATAQVHASLANYYLALAAMS